MKKIIVMVLMFGLVLGNCNASFRNKVSLDTLTGIWTGNCLLEGYYGGVRLVIKDTGEITGTIGLLNWDNTGNNFSYQKVNITGACSYFGDTIMFHCELNGMKLAMEGYIFANNNSTLTITFTCTNLSKEKNYFSEGSFTNLSKELLNGTR